MLVGCFKWVHVSEIMLDMQISCGFEKSKTQSVEFYRLIDCRICKIYKLERNWLGK